jgi:CelD/BcsL family acetyltransferase involved in cellulose biosynthesis
VDEGWGSVKVETHCTNQIFETLRAEWNALLTQSVTDTLFLTWEFQATWWRHFGANNSLYVLTVRADDGELLGIAPLYVEPDAQLGKALRLIGGIEVADYLDFIVQRGHETAVYDAFGEVLLAKRDGAWDVLDLRNMPTASPTREAVAIRATQRNLVVTDKVEEVCPIIDLPTTFDAYLESLDKKQRHEVRRKIRKAYNEAQINWHIVGVEHDWAQALDGFIELQKRSMADKQTFMTPQMEAFFRDLARIVYDAGWLELSFIAVDGQRAATYFSFNYMGDTLLYNSGYDPNLFSALSPGIVLLAQLVEHAIEQKQKHFDFLQGNEVYKYRMGAHDTLVHQVTVGKSSVNSEQ